MPTFHDIFFSDMPVEPITILAKPNLKQGFTTGITLPKKKEIKMKLTDFLDFKEDKPSETTTKAKTPVKRKRVYVEGVDKGVNIRKVLRDEFPDLAEVAVEDWAQRLYKAEDNKLEIYKKNFERK